MAIIRWQLIAPIADRAAFKVEILGTPYRSGCLKVDNDGEHLVSDLIVATAPDQFAKHVLLVVDVYAGAAFLIVGDDKPATMPAAARSVSSIGEDDLPSTLLIADGEAPDVPTREIRALRVGQQFFFLAAER
jgi:hypothetical protein